MTDRMIEAKLSSWRRVASPEVASYLAMQQQLSESQWCSPADLAGREAAALQSLLYHAGQEVPYYAEQFKKLDIADVRKFNIDLWEYLPVLSRAALRDLGPLLHARHYPDSFGNSGFSTSGGSTGVPVRVKKTDFDGFFWNVMGQREALWHFDRLDGVVANLRGIGSELYTTLYSAPLTKRVSKGIVIEGWGAPLGLLWQTGPMGLMQPGADHQAVVEFLTTLNPHHILIRPSGLRLLLHYIKAQNIRLPRLATVWTISETVTDDLRELCQSVLGAELISNYSAAEIGIIALQCPSHGGYHVMSETVKVEILDAENRPCGKGEIGRVVVTSLTNRAMPLIRYAIGDEAEVGGPCPCGRGLMRLERIVGRTENYLVRPDKSRMRFDVSHYRIAALEFVLEFQVVQTDYDRLTLKVVPALTIGPNEIDILKNLINRNFGKWFTTDVVVVEALPRTASGKLLPFVSELPDQRSVKP